MPLLDHIVLSHIAKHLITTILLDSQHGFQERLFTVILLITTTHDWATTLQHCGKTDVILLDFSKAFDKVPHLRLSAKLHIIMVSETTHWIRSLFLANGTLGYILLITEVPQGPVLGLALFFLYNNNIKPNSKI